MRKRAGALSAVAATALALGLFVPAPAPAAYEQVDVFSGIPGELHPLEFKEWPEEVQLSGAGGMAVNYTGAGGVPAGTLYAATQYGGLGGEGTRVARFDPDGTFNENWTFQGNPPSERCGPGGEAAHPVCQSRSGAGPPPIDVEVDQGTGYVYVFGGSGFAPGANQIHVYSPDGSEVIAEFAQQAAGAETIATNPEKTHTTSSHDNIALVGGGVVYVWDEDFAGAKRLMAFEPQAPGEYEHYVYAGTAKDISIANRARAPVPDEAGHLYTVGGPNNSIAELDPSKPANPILCEFSFPKGHIDAMTVNPKTEEPFFYTDTDKKIHRLEACKEGKFSEAGSFGFEPKRFELSALAFDPLASFSPGRAPGILYGAAPSGEGGPEEDTPPNIEEEAALGYVFAAPLELDPEVLSESVEHVATTSADLRAQINPKGPPTTFAFQYISQSAWEANEASDRFAGGAESPLGGAPLGEGPKPLAAATSLSGLEPDTTYHYRALATNHCSEEDKEKLCEGVGQDQTFHTYPSQAPGLPDERAWELVSPALKGGGQVLPADPSFGSCSSCKPGGSLDQFPRQSRPDGEAIVYQGTPFAAGQGAVKANQYISRRDPLAGWQTTNPTPLLLRPEDRGYRAFDRELDLGILAQSTPAFSPGAPPEYQDLYTQSSADPLAFTPLLTAEPPNRSASGEGALKLTYAGASTDFSRIFFEANDALTAETPFAPEAVDGGAKENNLYEWSDGQLRLVNVMPGNGASEPGASFATAGANAISQDGSRVYWSDAAGQLYLRESAEATLEIGDPGHFLSASSDGSKVLLDDGCLYDLTEEQCEDLSQGKGGFEGIAGQSEDLSRIYFVDDAVLSGEEENSEGAKAQAAKANLYAFSQGTTTYLATLVQQDGSGGTFTHSDSFSPLPSRRTAEASPNGRFLAFQSQAPLTGYDNTGPCASNNKGGLIDGPCSEVFLYDSATEELHCASCDPANTAPLGWSALRLINGGANSLPQPRYLTDQGRLYFDSRDSLSPFDTNHGAEDVYQYEPDEVGSCKRAAGCLSLISAGSEAIDSNLLAIDETGANVFFTSRDQLVLKDEDDLIDLYDAREGGGIPSETEVGRGECQGEACQPPAVAPARPTPATSALAGDGNVEEKKVSKKRRHGKRHTRRHAKRHEHKGHRHGGKR